jgi:hypothetical protein
VRVGSRLKKRELVTLYWYIHRLELQEMNRNGVSRELVFQVNRKLFISTRCKCYQRIIASWFWFFKKWYESCEVLVSLLSRKGKYALMRLYPNSDYMPVELAGSNDNNIVRTFSVLNIAARPTIPSLLSKSDPEAARSAFPSWAFQRYIVSPASINFF